MAIPPLHHQPARCRDHTVEVPVANKTDSPPADEGEPKPDTSNTVTSRRLSAPAAARKHSRAAPRAA